MTQLNDTSTIHEVQCQVQENHLGELLGRVIDIETKFNMVALQNQKLNSMLSDYENTKKKVEDWKKDYAELKSNADAFQTGMKEAREQLKKVTAERQAAQEEILSMKEAAEKELKAVTKAGRKELARVTAQRQAAQEEALALREEIAALKAPKPRRKTRKVANGKYNQNQAQ